MNTRSVIARSVPEHPVPRRIRLLLCAVAVTAAVVAPAGSLSAVPDQVVGGSTAAPGTSIVVTAQFGDVAADYPTATFPALNDGTNIIPFQARYYATGAATAGTANADATFKVQYE